MAEFQGTLSVDQDESSLDGTVLAKAGVSDEAQAIAAATAFLEDKELMDGDAITVSGTKSQFNTVAVILMVDAWATVAASLEAQRAVSPKRSRTKGRARTKKAKKRKKASVRSASKIGRKRSRKRARKNRRKV